jgi:hypothetical protein
MASPTVPTVTFPTPTGNDDTDDDDDNDDNVSSVLLGPLPPTTTPTLPQPPISATVVLAPTPIVNSIPISDTPLPEQGQGPISTGEFPAPSDIDSLTSPTGPAGSLPSGGVPNPVVPANAPTNDSRGLSVGASAGIGVAVALAVVLMAIACWVFTHRRKRIRRMRTRSGDSTINGVSPDEEIAKKSQIYAHYAGSPFEIGGGKGMDVNHSRRSELASPVIPVEAVGDREFPVELQGSEVPTGSEKGGERLFSDVPVDVNDVPDDPEPRFMDKKV